ncbi:hypothetical protein [Nostoc sp. UIC 10630]|uniref:hypothetical protein n=1 Tax=Nostoc sp. UIC 10630 TaxID=2100146 RepID=UPI0013D099A1|nr:hypothetical protein [Nostoc sp. UIC 10630]MBE8997933.1 hypothetical protein [Nostoc sp. LEGE 12447]NEU82055.1 hypothetical protein [Nostoc sp. UIC 10630]
MKNFSYLAFWLTDGLAMKLKTKTAQESNLIHTAEALENQLSQLQQELGDNSDTQLQSLMSL